MEAKCPYFGKCNGCSLQHITYDVQLDNKKKALGSCIGNLGVEVNTFSGDEFFYRNRMDFIFHSRGLGFRQKDNAWKIVDIERCVIADKRINGLLSEVRQEFKDVDDKTFKFLVIRSVSSGTSLSFVLNSKSTRLLKAIDKIKEYAAKSSADNVVVTRVEGADSISEDYFVVKGSDMLEEEYLGRRFLFNVQGFFQNNNIVAGMMQEYVNGLLKGYDCSDATLLDLYSGVGTFGIINANIFSKVVMVESFPGCVEAMKRNVEMNKITNSEEFLMDAKQVRKVAVNGRVFVITDPPRSGMDLKTIQWLDENKPEVIIYVSCNMQQLAKDLKKLGGYTVKSAALFDMFPQTRHCESVLELVRKGH